MTSTFEDVVDGVSTSTAVKAPVRCATTANITLSGFQTIDGVALTSADENLRVLVWNQTDATENGIYDAKIGTWERSADFDGARDVRDGTLVRITEGSTYAGAWFEVTTDDPITIGTTSLTFSTSTFPLDEVQQVNGITALRELSPTVGSVFLNYHTTAGDGGHGPFRGVTGAAAGTYTDDDGITIVPTGGDGSAAWLRVYNVIYADYFGLVGDGVADNTSKIQSAIDESDSAGQNLIFFQKQGTFLVTDLTGLNGKRLVSAAPDTFIKIGSTTFEIPGLEGTHGKLELYVATTGSDSTNCGITSSVPFATVQQALDFLPPNINHEVVINIADGTYTTQSGEDEFGRPVLVDVSKKNVSPLRDTDLALNTKGAKITFRGTSEAGTIFDGAAKTARYGFWVHGTKDIEIESMTIQACYAGVIAHQGGDVTLYDVTTTGNNYGRIIESGARMEVIRGTSTANGRNYYIKNGALQENDSEVSSGTTYDFELEGAPYVYLLRVSGGASSGRPYIQSEGSGSIEFDACDIDGGATFAQGSCNTLIISNGTRIQNFTSSVFALDFGYVDAQGTTSHIHGNAFVGFTSKGGQILNLTSCDSLNESAVDDPNTNGIRCGGHSNTAKLSPNVSVTDSNKILTRPTAGIVFKGTAPPTDANTFYELGSVTLNESASTSGTPYWVCTTRGYGSSAAWTEAAPVTQRTLTALSNAQLKALAATPIEVVAAPGSGKFIYVLGWRFRLIFGATAMDDAAADGNLTLEYDGGSTIDTMEADGLIDATATTQGLSGNLTELLVAESGIDNKAVDISNDGAEFTGASSDSTAEVEVFYRVLNSNPS